MNKIVFPILMCMMLGNTIAAEPFKVTNSFTPNTPAKAADVNRNFNDVAGAINKINNAVDNASFQGKVTKQITGKVTIPTNSKDVVGSDTLFTKELIIGDILLIADETATVTTITDDTHLSLDTARHDGALQAAAYTNTDLMTLKDSSGKTNALVDRSGNLMRHIAYATGQSEDVSQSGKIDSRVLNVSKRFNDETVLRIGYTDNLRVYGADATCRWEIKIDGKSCSTPLVFDYYVADDAGNVLNIHRSQSLYGYCGGVTPGPHQVQIWVGTVPDYKAGSCQTGWHKSTWTLEAEEVFVQ